MRRVIVTSFLVAAVFTAVVIAINPKAEGTSTNLPQIETVGLPEHGLALVGPQDSTFSRLATEKTTRDDRSANNPYSVFVVNQTAKAVAACLVIWELHQADGKINTHTEAKGGSFQTASDGRSVPFAEAIAPNGSLLFSLIDSGQRAGKNFRMGGGFDINSQLSNSVKVIASIDGVLFADGTFVGADTKNYFAQLRGEIDGRQELSDELIQAMERRADSQTLQSQIRAFVSAQAGDAQQSSAEDSRYALGKWLAKKSYASLLLAMEQEKGEQAVLEFIRTQSRKPKVNLRKMS
jgi:hypothetical protein